jgi:hypothetical protein
MDGDTAPLPAGGRRLTAVAPLLLLEEVPEKRRELWSLRRCVCWVQQVSSGNEEGPVEAQKVGGGQQGCASMRSAAGVSSRPTSQARSVDDLCDPVSLSVNVATLPPAEFAVGDEGWNVFASSDWVSTRRRRFVSRPRGRGRLVMVAVQQCAVRGQRRTMGCVHARDACRTDAQ